MRTPDAALREAIRSALPALGAISDANAAHPRVPGKWSRKEILGHLIDSASNNHQRFVRAQLTDELLCSPYDQEAWVKVQQYGESGWHELIGLWRRFNLHLAHVMEVFPHDALTRPRVRHNLDAVAFRAVPADRPTTLEYFMHDYVAHLEHHLAQIFERETG